MLDDLTASRDFRLAQDFIKAYHAARSGLVTLEILRSERLLQGDYAEWLVARVLKLTLASSGVQKGFDATDSAGQTYQVKSRIVASVHERTSFDMAHADAAFDFLIGVFFSRTLDVLAIIRIPRDAVTRMGSQSRSSFRLRWNSTSAGDPDVEYLYRASEPTAVIVAAQI